MRKPLFLTCLPTIIVLSACYGNAHSTYTGGPIDYQYDEPQTYCHRVQTSTGFEEYCPEGRIEIEFITLTLGDTISSVLMAQLANLPTSSDYTLIELESIAKVQEPRPKVALAELSNLASVGQSDAPTYLAAIPFGTKRVALAQGFLYNAQFEIDFHPAFRVVVLTLQPVGIEP